MDNHDTIKLLQECDAGSKMAVSSIDDVMEKICKQELKDIFDKNKAEHAKIGNEIHELLEKHGYEDKDASMIARGMSYVKTNVKLAMDDSEKSVAKLMTEGCNMGITSLNEYLNEYENADEKAKKICRQLIKLEEELRDAVAPCL